VNDRFVATIRESNRQGRDASARFAGHRDRVTSILMGVAARSSLCILGAGNLNDVWLDPLLKAYTKVHLVDLDVDAVLAGLASLGWAHSKTIQVHGPIDLSGILDRLPSGDTEQDAAGPLLELLARHRCAIPSRPFGVTLSAGMLTQLLQSVVEASLAPTNIVPVCVALRDKHLVDLVHLTRPGGTLILVTDVVSTTTAPQLLNATTTGLEGQMAELVASGNFFTGTNPYRIIALLEEDERFRDLVTDVRMVEPWLWRVTAYRDHLTCAIVARRSMAPSPPCDRGTPVK
jgi:hypothetical protein